MGRGVLGEMADLGVGDQITREAFVVRSPPFQVAGGCAIAPVCSGHLRFHFGVFKTSKCVEPWAWHGQ